MKSLTSIVCYVFVCILVVGCTSTKVTENTSMYGKEKLPKPDRVYVFPFAATPADIPSWSKAAQMHVKTSRPQSPEAIENGRKLGGLIAEELAAQINEMGLAAFVGGKDTVRRLNDIWLMGYFVAIDEGSATKRIALGFGAGAADLKTAVEGYQVTKDGLRQLGEGKVQSGEEETPGVVVPLVVLAATANPIGLVIGGAAKATGEVTDRNTIVGAAKETAKAIADHLRVKMKEQGWSR
ncbi:MAG: DUF4410 domain-containing protein [Nitrospirales bacterium]|nr:DUF4410 domain-containing protein [Nitrospirales bacterium]